ncbi:Oidioi.mRNA.OKI2018_I69.chr2.g4188.t1.cds [Oikopleura dioica]|uniref:Oidioi.mRNA.OKI2018_I69.chr2.g4188.t1.cds n=1 Tax=Oikopleura dioica TaxID=34765 RepID=A0ABN7SWH7_OIKDI|nr:Oidioi.mRNA.OKI2018_I69.chr2.g4188.t1.cds [Oikopleura dioica]
MNNCLEIGNIASQLKLSEVDDFINRFLLQNFTSIPDFCKIQFERFKFLLSSNDLQGLITPGFGKKEAYRKKIDSPAQENSWNRSNSRSSIVDIVTKINES